MKIIDQNTLSNKNLYPYFYSDAYAAFIKEKEEKDIIYLADDDYNTIVCKIWKNKFLKLLQPIYPPLDKNANRLDSQKEQFFLNTFLNYIKNKKIAHRITQSENFAIFKSIPEFSVSVPFGTYYLNLEKNTEEELFKKLHPKHRNVIKNAEKNNVVIKYGEECINDFYLLYKQTMLRSDMFCPDISYFKKFYTDFDPSIICGVVYYNEIPQGSLFIPYTQFGAFYLYGGSAQKVEINGSINYLHWNTIKLLKTKGVRRYDFVGARLSDLTGTKLHGIQQFKKRFGAELEEGFLWKKDLDFFDCFVFDELIRLKYKLKNEVPLLDIIDEELSKDYFPNNATTLSSIIKNKIEIEARKFHKKTRKFKKEISAGDLLNNLKSAGIKRGDTIIVHSSLSKIGNVKGGPKTIISSLLECIGKDGNLIMPCYSYIDSMEKTANEQSFCFDLINTPSVVGVITEEFRKWPGVKRSIHPTHSFCAYGPKADYITEGHLKASTNFGIDTPLYRAKELKGKVVGLGILIGPVTIYHVIEDIYPLKFKDVYHTKPASLKIRINEKEILKPVFIHNSASHLRRIDKVKNIETWFMRYFMEKNILHIGKFGEGNIWWMSVEEVIEEQEKLLEKNISIYNAPDVE